MSEYKENFQLISSHLTGGETFIHVISENKPDSGFELVDANLEDVYFSTLKGSGIEVAI